MRSFCCQEPVRETIQGTALIQQSWGCEPHENRESIQDELLPYRAGESTIGLGAKAARVRSWP